MKKNDNIVVAPFSLSAESKNISAEESPDGTFSEIMNQNKTKLPARGILLQPWEFRIHVK